MTREERGRQVMVMVMGSSDAIKEWERAGDLIQLQTTQHNERKCGVVWKTIACCINMIARLFVDIVDEERRGINTGTAPREKLVSSGKTMTFRPTT